VGRRERKGGKWAKVDRYKRGHSEEWELEEFHLNSGSKKSDATGRKGKEKGIGHI